MALAEASEAESAAAPAQVRGRQRLAWSPFPESLVRLGTAPGCQSTGDERDWMDNSVNSYKIKFCDYAMMCQSSTQLMDAEAVSSLGP